jgi:hypothetical protein
MALHNRSEIPLLLESYTLSHVHNGGGEGPVKSDRPETPLTAVPIVRLLMQASDLSPGRNRAHLIAAPLIFATMKGRLPMSHRSKAVFESQSGRVAQLVEQCPFKAWVVGSSPTALTS